MSPFHNLPCSPQATIAILDELRQHGFDNQAFRLIHHFGENADIQVHLDYCATVESFQRDGQNERVHQRLGAVFAAFKCGAFTSPAKPGVFEALAIAARKELPLSSSVT
jgi:hypothetical protein